MKFLSKKNFLFFTVLLSAYAISAEESEIADPFPYVSSQGGGTSATGRSDKAQYVGKNPAGIAGIDSWNILLDHRKTQIGTGIMYTGFFGQIRHTSFGAGVVFNSNHLDNLDMNMKTYFLSGFHLSMASDKFLKINTGVSIFYNQPNNELYKKRGGFDLGGQYIAKTPTEKFFSIQQFSLGVNLRTVYGINSDESHFFYVIPRPGISITWIDREYLNVKSFLDFSSEKDFTRLSTSFGLEFSSFDIFMLRAGYYGNDFFTSDNFHIGFGLKYNIGIFSARVDTSQTRYSGENSKSMRGRSNFSVSLGLKRSENFLGTEVVQVVPSYYSFSPNDDGIEDTVYVAIPKKLTNASTDWNLIIRDGDQPVFMAENKVFDINRLDESPNQILWDGKNKKGEMVDDGNYTVTFFSLQKTGKIFQADLATINVNKRKPLGLMEVTPDTYDLYSDEEPISINIRADLYSTSNVAITITNELSQVIFSDICQGKELPCKFSWWPKSGNIVKPGVYEVIASINNKAGGKSNQIKKQVHLNFGKPPIVLTTQSGRISNKDLRRNGIIIKLKKVLNFEPENLFIDVQSSDGTLLKSIPVFAKTQKIISWKPAKFDKEYNGLISFNLRESGANKNIIISSTNIFIDSKVPEINLVVFPENDFVPNWDKPLTFRIICQDETNISSWKITVQDQFNRPLWKSGGQGDPPPVINWNGFEGESPALEGNNVYYVVASAVDGVGQFKKSELKKFTTGTMVIAPLEEKETFKFGDRNVKLGLKQKYKIKLPDILFEPNSTIPKKEMHKIIKELAPYLLSLTDFRFIIEGHVNPVKTLTEEEMKEFSMKRSIAIFQILQSFGLSEKLMTTTGLGGTRPIGKDESLAEQARNRRVEIILIRNKPEKNKT